MDAATITTSSASALVAAIRTGDATARAVLDAHLAVYERRNPQVNAVIATRFDEARAEAGAADARVAAATTDAGRAALPPLLGVPVTIKESIALKGMPNSAGVIARGEFRSTETAPAAQRLIDAGAIPIGVTNTSELTLWIESWNRLYGRTSSPYGRGRTAGGSSGGEGAAVGAGIVPLGLGSDIGGSIRIPAFCGGVFGLKPTPRVVPYDGAWPPLPERAVDLFANGPIVRRAEDLMPALRVLATTEAEPRLGDPAGVDLATLRVLVSQGAWPTRVSDDLLYARERAAGALAAHGSRIDNQVMRWARRGLELYLATLQASADGPTSDLLLNAGADPLGFRRPRRGGPHTLATHILLASEKIGARAPAALNKRQLAAGRALTSRLIDAVGDGVLLHPPLPTVAPKHGRTVGRPWWLANFALFNLTGMPVVEVPLGLDAKGLPLGVQVAARPGNEHVAIAVALELERVFGGWVPPP